MHLSNTSIFHWLQSLTCCSIRTGLSEPSRSYVVPVTGRRYMARLTTCLNACISRLPSSGWDSMAAHAKAFADKALRSDITPALVCKSCLPLNLAGLCRAQASTRTRRQHRQWSGDLHSSASGLLLPPEHTAGHCWADSLSQSIVR